MKEIKEKRKEKKREEKIWNESYAVLKHGNF